MEFNDIVNMQKIVVSTIENNFLEDENEKLDIINKGLLSIKDKIQNGEKVQVTLNDISNYLNIIIVLNSKGKIDISIFELVGGIYNRMLKIMNDNQGLPVIQEEVDNEYPDIIKSIEEKNVNSSENIEMEITEKNNDQELNEKEKIVKPSKKITKEDKLKKKIKKKIKKMKK